MDSPIDIECKLISENPSRYTFDDFPPAESSQEVLDRAYRHEARRQTALNWPGVFETLLNQWAEEKDLPAVISDDRYERYLRRCDEIGKPLITLYLGREEAEAFRYWQSLTSMAHGDFMKMSLEDIQCLRNWKVDCIYAGVGLVTVTQRSYWRFV